MIKVENLSLSVNSEPILKNINLHCKENECFAILGPNGSGKTTLIETILGYIKPTYGTLRIWGQEFSKVKDRIGVLLEYPPLFYYAKVKEIISYVCCAYNISPDSIKFIKNYLDITEIENKFVRVLSKGQRKKLGLLIALIHDPPLLLLDEPTSGMDPFAREKIWNLLKKKQRSIIFTTHIWEEAEKNSDRIAFIHNGEIIKVDTPSSFLSNKYIITNKKLILPKSKKYPNILLKENFFIEKEDTYWVYPENLNGLLNKLKKNNAFSVSSISLEDVFIFLVERGAKH